MIHLQSDSFSQTGDILFCPGIKISAGENLTAQQEAMTLTSPEHAQP
jgi:hypothetical protein